MNNNHAEKTALVAQQSSMILDAHLNYLKEELDADEFQLACKTFGKAMGEIYFQILEPIWKKYPELLPEKMGGKYKVDNAMYNELSLVVKKYVYKNS